jgi:NAD(P)-dependent dehydrogenase (short-subunit alcohol dehydrogenase family)
VQLEAGDVAVVTGGASGIGFGLAEAFAKRKLSIVLADVRQLALEATADRRRRHGVEVLAVTADVRDAEAVDGLARLALDRFGHIELVCNNAGVAPSPAPMWQLELATWRWTIDVALLGVVHGIRAFAPILIGQGRGHIVNTASVGGLIPLPGMGPYNAVKHAVVGLSETLQLELSAVTPEVGVSVLCPGLVDTDLPLSTRLNQPGGSGTIDPGDSPPSMSSQAGPGRTILTPEQVAEATLAAIESNQLHVITHEDSRGPVIARLNGVLADLPQASAHVGSAASRDVDPI